MAGDLVTQTEFARRVKISRPRISQLIAAGRLPTVPGPRRNQRLIPWAEGKAAWDADRGISPAEGAVFVSEAGVHSARPSAAQDGEATAADFARQLARARAADKAYQAEVRRLKLEELRGSLVSVSDVEADARALAADLRAKLVALPTRICPLCEGQPLAVAEQTWEDAINDVLGAVHGGRYVGSE